MDHGADSFLTLTTTERNVKQLLLNEHEAAFVRLGEKVLGMESTNLIKAFDPDEHNALGMALYFAARGFEVFPLKPNLKKPATVHGFYDASRDPNQISSWFTATDCGMGIRTGMASKLLVIDIDVKDGVTIHERVSEFEKAIGEKLPDTLTMMTPSGGCHLYFSITEPIGCSVGLIKGVDIRCEGGYVAAPPTVISEGEFPGKYEFDVAMGFEIAPLPDSVREFVLHKKPIGVPLYRTLLEQGNLGRNGYRNHSVASVVGHLLRRYVDPDLVQILAHSFNQTISSPSLPWREVEATISSLARKEFLRRQNKVGGQ